MRYCFDLDDTISIHNNRDYPNAVPVRGVIDNIIRLKVIDKDAHIIIHTSRGMNSCNGDVKLAEQRNRPVIEQWLEAHDVPYDEIIFGKPLADVYIDDKAVNAKDFEALGVGRYNGFSGASILRVADIVVKSGAKTKFEYVWYKGEENAPFREHYTPRVFSYTLGSLYLENIQGDVLSDLLAKATQDEAEEYLFKVGSILHEYAERKTGGTNDAQAYCEFIRQRATGNIDVTELCSKIAEDENLETATSCHGDFTALNIIVKKGRMYLIDPSHAPLSSWLLDAAKFRASLNGLDAALTGRQCTTRHLLPVFDSIFPKYTETIRLLEKTHYIRVMYYARIQENNLVYDKLLTLLNL